LRDHWFLLASSHSWSGTPFPTSVPVFPPISLLYPENWCYRFVQNIHIHRSNYMASHVTRPSPWMKEKLRSVYKITKGTTHLNTANTF
jgi:hypothetical protein